MACSDSHGQVHDSGKRFKSTAQFCAFNTGNGTAGKPKLHGYMKYVSEKAFFRRG